MKTKRKPGYELTDIWYCPKCNRWVHPWHQGCRQGKTYTNCPICWEELEDEEG